MQRCRVIKGCSITVRQKRPSANVILPLRLTLWKCCCWSSGTLIGTGAVIAVCADAEKGRDSAILAIFGSSLTASFRGTFGKLFQPFKVLRRVVIQYGSAIRHIQLSQNASAAFCRAAQAARPVVGHQHGNERRIQNDGMMATRYIFIPPRL